jgi:hypothetical protein
MTGNDRPIGWWLKRLDRLIEASFEDALTKAGMDRRQWQTLNAMAGRAVREAELAEALSPFVEGSHTELRRVVRDLQARGWVTQDNSETLALTADGASARMDASTSVVPIRERLSEGISVEDYQRTINALQRMAANLESRLDA